MRRRIAALAERLEEFVSEDGHEVLVVDCPASAVGIVGAAVDRNEQTGSTDLSIPFFGAFDDAQACARTLGPQIDALAAAIGLAPRPETRESPEQALALALLHLARGARRLGDVRVAIWLCPSAIRDEAAYLRLGVALARRARDVAPPLRVALRETDGSVRAALAHAGIRTLDVAIALSPAALREGFAEDAADPEADPRARAAASLAVAMADADAGREHDALASLTSLASFHRERGDVPSHALCVVLAGSLLARVGALDEGRAVLARGLALSLEKAPAVALSATFSGGELAMRAHDWVEADAHFDAAARIAARLGQLRFVAQALCRRAEALHALDRSDRAVQALACAATAAKASGATEIQRQALSALAALYRDAGMSGRARAVETHLAALAPAAHAPCAHDHAHDHAP